ncbi:hypothetical protein NFI96_025671, partial [Prochilodus magdalenae]
MMPCSGLMGLFLLSLLSPAAWAEIGNLQLIINFLQSNYGGGGQFAVAINIAASKCAAGVTPDQNFLPNDPAQTVRNSIAGPTKVYIGHELIGAKPKPIPKRPDLNYHSEYLLLIKSNPPATSTADPLMQKLLNSNPHGCVVFYSVVFLARFNKESPCVNNAA